VEKKIRKIDVTSYALLHKTDMIIIIQLCNYPESKTGAKQRKWLLDFNLKQTCFYFPDIKRLFKISPKSIHDVLSTQIFEF